MSDFPKIHNPSHIKISSLLLLYLIVTWAISSPTENRVRVVCASDPQLVHLFVPDADRVCKLFNKAFIQYMNCGTTAEAWKKLVLPTDRVGIKIHTLPGSVMSTRMVLVECVIDGLEQAGVSREHIIVFDRYAPQMEMAGYCTGVRSDGVQIMATVPSAGYDPDQSIDSSLPGKLVWGDYEFKKDPSEKENQISTKSYYSRILTQQIDKMINLAVPMADPDLGFYGCQLSASLSLVDNFRRFHKPSFTREDSIVEIFSNATLQKKCVLHVLDSLIVQFAGGPSFEPQYCWPHQTIYISQDAVALDTLMLQQINQRRPKMELPEIKNEVAYLKATAEAGLGVGDLSRIEVVDVKP